LDECSQSIRDAVHELLRASTSSEGYEKILGCTLTNGFLGHLVGGRGVLNEHSFNFRLFGEPSTEEPWAYTYFGHHVCLAVFVRGTQMVIGPTLLGAEPDRIDEGPHAGLRLFKEEEIVALDLMRGLRPDLQRMACLSEKLGGDALPEGRWNPFDER
jgi:Protein of unknown function (DUF3500)